MGTGLGKENGEERSRTGKMSGLQGELWKENGVNDIKELSIGCEIHIIYVAT